jgi:hypothetical protein
MTVNGARASIRAGPKVAFPPRLGRFRACPEGLQWGQNRKPKPLNRASASRRNPPVDADWLRGSTRRSVGMRATELMRRMTPGRTPVAGRATFQHDGRGQLGFCRLPGTLDTIWPGPRQERPKG